MVQEVGFAKLKALIAADSPQSFLDDTPTSKLIRQILGAVSKFDKAMVVAKLKGARERKRVPTGKKRRSKVASLTAELHPEVVALVRQLRRRRPKGGQRSLRDIAAELAARGHLNELECRTLQRPSPRCSPPDPPSRFFLDEASLPPFRGCLINGYP